MEQITEPVENHANEIPQQISEDDHHTRKSKITQIIHQMMIFKKPQKNPKTPHCKKNPKIPVLKITIYDLTPFQTTLTHTDTKKTTTEEIFFITVSLNPHYNVRRSLLFIFLRNDSSTRR